VAETAAEVRGFEPLEALIAADNGYSDLNRIIAEAPAFLAPGGLLALETGIDQHARLLEVARSSGFSRVQSQQDLSGRDRFVLAFR
jgi:release factor glutamine methyltransferase